MKKLIAMAALMLCGVTAKAGMVTVVAPDTVNGPFDVTVQVTDVFQGRDLLTDGIISYGFNVGISNPSVFTFLGATSGPLFDAATAEPGTDVFGAASGIGIFPPVEEPLQLAVLHFGVVGSGTSDITISTDLTNLFHGLQFINDPFQDPISGSVSVNAVPEPAELGTIGTGIGVLLFFIRLRRRHIR